MYKVLVVDDEPTGIRHICRILNKYCSDFELVGTADNGAEAFNMLETCRADVVITDVCMPIMDGIQLAKRIQKEYTNICTIIVSGFSEFEYAKQAIVANVSDYLLKPLLPADLIHTLQSVKEKLDKLYYEKKYDVLRKLYNGIHDDGRLEQLFCEKNYLCILSKTTGMIKCNIKADESWMYLEENGYCFTGRDETEELYLIPVEEGNAEKDDILSAVKNKYERMEGYTTIVYDETMFSIEKLPDRLQKIFKKVEEVTVVGVTQLCSTDATVINRTDDAEKLFVSRIEVVIINRKTDEIIEEMEGLLDLFEKKQVPAKMIKSTMRHLTYMIYNSYKSKMNYMDIDHMVEDCFRMALNFSQLHENLLAVMKQCFFEKASQKEDNRKILFEQIKEYLYIHLRESISVSEICKEFGVSQATLSRIFRNYGNTTFSEYVTSVRIQEAKRIMQYKPDALIKDIAEKVGYNDPFYFSRMFRLIEGRSPTEYLDNMGVI